MRAGACGSPSAHRAERRQSRQVEKTEGTELVMSPGKRDQSRVDTTMLVCVEQKDAE